MEKTTQKGFTPLEKNSNVFTRATSKSSLTGFTLIEMIVSLGIFMIVVTISISTLLAIVNANRETQTLKIAINNTFFAFETMTRLIRTGTRYHCLPNNPSNIDTYDFDDVDDPLDCTSGGNTSSDEDSNVLFFVSDTGQLIRLRKVVQGGVGFIEQSVNDGTGWITGFHLTSDEINIRNLEFQVTGTKTQSTAPLNSDDRQPMVTITMFATVGSPTGKNYAEVPLQTTVTQRAIDI